MVPKVQSLQELLVLLAEEDSHSSRKLQGSGNKCELLYNHYQKVSPNLWTSHYCYYSHFTLQHVMLRQLYCNAKQYKFYLFTQKTQQSSHEPFIQCLSIRIKLKFVVFVIERKPDRPVILKKNTKSKCKKTATYTCTYF